MSGAFDRDRPWLSQGRLAVLGTGAALPGAPVSTDALVARMQQQFGFSRERAARSIARNMGIEHRHFCRDFALPSEAERPGDSNTDLVARAVTAALGDAGLHIDDIGYIVGHTTTPAQPIPSNIALAADRLGYRGPHIELRQACTGFANALMIAFGLLARPDARPVVLVGSETGSLWFDALRVATDNGQLVNLMQMGDGAAAVVLGPADRAAAQIEASWFGAMGVGAEPGLQVHHGATEFDHDFTGIRATGSTLFDAGARAAGQHGIALSDMDVIVPHQVSGHIGALLAAHFAYPVERMFGNARRLGNTGSAAMWLALAELRADGLSDGETMLALGAEATKFMYGGFVYRHRCNS